jgi:hypothetical protein
VRTYPVGWRVNCPRHGRCANVCKGTTSWGPEGTPESGCVQKESRWGPIGRQHSCQALTCLAKEPAFYLVKPGFSQCTWQNASV